MDFFEEVTTPPSDLTDALRRSPRRMMQPQRPDNVLGVPLAIQLVLARTSEATVTVQEITAYPNGFGFEVVAQFRPKGQVWDPMHGLAFLRGKPGDRYGQLSDEHLRFGIEFADGGKATNVGPPMLSVPEGTRGPMLHDSGGGATASRAYTTYWAWPLPQSGPLGFVCEWPKYAIPVTRRDIDGALIIEAAQRAVELWP